MILKVKEYKDHPHNFHVCENVDGHEFQIDLFVSGHLRKAGETHMSIIGKTVNVATHHAYISIADEVCIAEDMDVSTFEKMLTPERRCDNAG